MKRMVRWVVGSVCTWLGESSDYDYSCVDAYLADPGSAPHARM